MVSMRVSTTWNRSASSSTCSQGAIPTDVPGIPASADRITREEAEMRKYQKPKLCYDHRVAVDDYEVLVYRAQDLLLPAQSRMIQRA